MALIINGERIETEEIESAAQQLGVSSEDSVDAAQTARDMAIARILVHQEIATT